MAQMYLHWGITPYAIYALAATVFAFTYYNMKKPFSLGPAFRRCWGTGNKGKAGRHHRRPLYFHTLRRYVGFPVHRGIFCGGRHIQHNRGIPTNGIMLIIVMAAIILVYTISASSGIMKGIKWLSSFNVYIFSFLILFIFLFGPTKFILNFGVESVGELMDSFFMRNLFTDSMNLGNSSWSSLGNMKVGYWASYLAAGSGYSPVFRKAGKGIQNQGLYYHKSVCAHCFSMIWVSIFGGTAIHAYAGKSDSAAGDFRGRIHCI